MKIFKQENVLQEKRKIAKKEFSLENFCVVGFDSESGQIHVYVKRT